MQLRYEHRCTHDATFAPLSKAQLKCTGTGTGFFRIFLRMQSRYEHRCTHDGARNAVHRVESSSLLRCALRLHFLQRLLFDRVAFETQPLNLIAHFLNIRGHRFETLNFSTQYKFYTLSR